MKKLVQSLADDTMSVNGNSVLQSKGTPGRNHVKMEHQEQEMVKVKNSVNEQIISDISMDEVDQKITIKPAKGHDFENSGCPSNFLLLCLNSIKNALWHDGIFSGEEDKPLFVDTWGFEFWKCYSAGKDILETSGVCSTTQQIAWITSTAADRIASLEKEGLSFNSPFLLYLVPSKEKATKFFFSAFNLSLENLILMCCVPWHLKVRSVCKPLKALGIHAVSLPSGSSLDHQIHGLKSCEPEFIISTPKRLLELVSLKAIDISGVSVLVVDDLEAFIEGGYFDIIQSIKQAISGNPQTIVFSNCLNYASVPLVRNLLRGSICRLALNDSIASQSACIIQSVRV
ncbi:uncharacterized protein LOC132303456 isoform X1 [Cornus florida]|uniref:uncharacterized protein LOC132303456 isoform X1 n=1 Tax=Cornus florida TaxID=4283 RepID=UPI0028A225A3|nr:uncharacterized protein LOC132303456 isoform X1 [Cornus florida]